MIKIPIYKEIIICIVTIIFIITINAITDRYEKDSIRYISEDLDSLKEKLIEIENNKINTGENQNYNNKINEKLEKVENTWNDRYKTLAYFIEHDELEKVNTEIIELKANIETEEYKDAIVGICKSTFILDHIKEKTELRLENFF